MGQDHHKPVLITFNHSCPGIHADQLNNITDPRIDSIAFKLTRHAVLAILPNVFPLLCKHMIQQGPNPTVSRLFRRIGCRFYALTPTRGNSTPFFIRTFKDFSVSRSRGVNAVIADHFCAILPRGAIFAERKKNPHAFFWLGGMLGI